MQHLRVPGREYVYATVPGCTPVRVTLDDDSFATPNPRSAQRESVGASRIFATPSSVTTMLACFDVAVDNAALVCPGETACDLHRNGDRIGYRQCTT